MYINVVGTNGRKYARLIGVNKVHFPSVGVTPNVNYFVCRPYFLNLVIANTKEMEGYLVRVRLLIGKIFNRVLGTSRR